MAFYDTSNLDFSYQKRENISLTFSCFRSNFIMVFDKGDRIFTAKEQNQIKRKNKKQNKKEKPQGRQRATVSRSVSA